MMMTRDVDEVVKEDSDKKQKSNKAKIESG